MAPSTKPWLLLCLLPSLIFTKSTCSTSSLAPGLRDSSSLRTLLDELESKVSSLESVIDERTQELKSKAESIQNMERIIQEKSEIIAMLQSEIDLLQEQLFKVKFEPASTSKKFIQGYGEWLPHSLSEHLTEVQRFVVTQWKDHLLPALDVSIQKAMEKKDQVKRWSEPHVETLNTKWIPTLKDTWITFTTYLEPRVQFLTTRTIEFYHSSKQSLTPYVLKALNLADGYIQVAKKHADPYIAQVVTKTKPHFDKAHVALEPYTKQIGHAYKKLMKSATIYHQTEMLKTNKLTKSVATMELAWFAATALLGLPVIFIIKLLSRISSTQRMRQSRKSQAVNGQRRAKRRHPY